jgi:hypothetical protein
MFLLKATREQLAHLLPAGGTGLEIGVADGYYADILLSAAQPARLHLIDPWMHQDDPDYVDDEMNVPGDEAGRRYEKVRQRFAGDIASGRVVIHRGFSQDFAASFPDGYFDWIYIDGAHHFEACARDLRLYTPKVKDDGLILGHDYAASPYARQKNFGVVEAVNGFIASGEVDMMLLTYEQFPTYVLCKRPLRPLPHVFMGQALARFDVAAEIRRPETKRFEQYIATIGDGRNTLAERLVLAFD